MDDNTTATARRVPNDATAGLDAHHTFCNGLMTLQPGGVHIYPTCVPCDGRCSTWTSS